MKLFAIYIGGELKGAHIEIHDMRFVVANALEETHAALRAQWVGIPSSLHIDCWAELSQADGYSVRLQRDPSPTSNKLFYVNLGGYDPREFTEMHKNMFVVADSPSKAKVRALKTVRHWNAFHLDNMYEAEQVFCINETVGDHHWHIHLEKIEDDSPPPFTCRYLKLGKAPSNPSQP